MVIDYTELFSIMRYQTGFCRLFSEIFSKKIEVCANADYISSNFTNMSITLNI